MYFSRNQPARITVQGLFFRSPQKWILTLMVICTIIQVVQITIKEERS